MPLFFTNEFGDWGASAYIFSFLSFIL